MVFNMVYSKQQDPVDINNKLRAELKAVDRYYNAHISKSGAFSLVQRAQEKKITYQSAGTPCSLSCQSETT